MSNKFSKMIRVNLSSSFVSRARCKRCGTTPQIYYYLNNPWVFHNPRDLVAASSSDQKYTKRMCSDFYFIDEPKSFKTEGYFSYTVRYKSFNPKYQKDRSFANNSITEFLSCTCGKTLWAFKERSIKNKPGIVNRKSKNKYSNNFSF